MEWPFASGYPYLEIIDLVVIEYLLYTSYVLDSGDRLVCKIVMVPASVGRVLE